MNVEMTFESHFKMEITGIQLSSEFELPEMIYASYVSNVICSPRDGGSVVITGTISSEDKNRIFLIAEDLKEFFLRLFSLFGVNCRVKSFFLDTTTDFLTAQIEGIHPRQTIEVTDVNCLAGKVAATFFDAKKSALFHDLIESNNSIDILHRFRSLFSVFYDISPKKKDNKWHIDYDAIKHDFIREIENLYQGAYHTRYRDIINEFINANLIDAPANINYSSLLAVSVQRLVGTNIINEEIAFNVLKCIQVIRNKANHGDFTGLSRKIIAGAYEFLLPLTQKMLKKLLT